MGINIGKKLIAWVDKPKSRALKITLSVIAVLAITVPVTSAYVVKKIAENYAETTAAADAEVLGSANTAPTNTAPIVAKESPVKTKKPEIKKAPEVDTKSAATEVAPTATPAQQSPYPDTYPAVLKEAYKNTMTDQWGLDNRGSASYAVWKVDEVLKNKSISTWNEDERKNVTNWPRLADELSVPRGLTPRVHSVAVVNNFATWVEAVNGDKVTVSFYNWGDSGAHGIWKDVPATNFSTYIYFQ